MLSSPRFPKALAQRIDALRIDDVAREQLHVRVHAAQRARRGEAATVAGLSASAQPTVAGWGVDGSLWSTAPARASLGAAGEPRPMRREREVATSQPRNSSSSRRHRDIAPPPPPDMPVVRDLLERVRGDRSRDPAELQGPSSSVVRLRHKRVELAGDFTYPRGTASERLTEAATRCEPLEAPVLRENRLVSLPPKPGARASKWKAGDFVQTRVAYSLISDTALLQNHRVPFMDFAKREQIPLRHRDYACEITPRRHRRVVRRLLATRHDDLGRIPTSFGSDELDPAEVQVCGARTSSATRPASHHRHHALMQTARLLLSTGLSIHRCSG